MGYNYGDEQPKYDYQPEGGFPPPEPKGELEPAVSLREVSAKWNRMILHPYTTTQSELANANWNFIVFSLVVGASVVLIVSVVLLLFTTGGYLGLSLPTLLLGTVNTTFVNFFGRFLVGAGLAYLFARAFRAQQGNFSQLAYIISLYAVPLMMLENLFSIAILFFPGLYMVVEVAIYIIYAFFLFVAVRGVHGLSSGAAIGVVISVLVVPFITIILALNSIGSLFGGLLSPFGG
jgi:hypothetical protein